MSTTVRVSEETRDRVVALAKATGRQVEQVVDDAVVGYERELFFTQLADGYATLAGDTQSWAQVQADRVGEASALADGLPCDEPPGTV